MAPLEEGASYLEGVAMSGKRYYWLKLKDDFFTSKRIKKLRSISGGDTYVIIYLKMQLLAMKNDGILRWTGLEEKFADELALDIDESPANVEMTLMYLQRTGLVETSDNINFFLRYAVENVGSEGASAQRWRDWNARQKALESNAELTASKQITNGEKEIELEIETRDRVRDKKRFTPPTVEEVQAYCEERKNSVDPETFVDFYTSKGWKVGNTPMKDWKAAVRTWERNRNGRNSNTGNAPKRSEEWNIHYD